ncbi:hypothetical protein Q4563_16240, partial [Gilvimarinus sp. 1_MG-2023]
TFSVCQEAVIGDDGGFGGFAVFSGHFFVGDPESTGAIRSEPSKDLGQAKTLPWFKINRLASPIAFVLAAVAGEPEKTTRGVFVKPQPAAFGCFQISVPSVDC